MDEPNHFELLTTWDVPALPTVLLAFVAALYVIGWFRAHKTRPLELPAWRLIAFLSGIASVFVAISSPLDTFSESLLFMHMAQHFVLMSVAPPLLVLGAPTVPLLRGLPRFAIQMTKPLFRSRTVHWLMRHARGNLVAWMAMNLAYVGWHIPAAYEFALRSETWHNVEHACFLFTSLLFWWPVVRPWPIRERQGSSRSNLLPRLEPTAERLLLIPYLLSADLVNTAVSAFLCFSGRLVYSSYADVQRPVAISPLNDQIAAGAFMWVFGSLIFLVPVAAIFVRTFSVPSLRLPDLVANDARPRDRAQREAV